MDWLATAANLSTRVCACSYTSAALSTPVRACFYTSAAPCAILLRGRLSPERRGLCKVTQWSLATPDENLGCVTQGQCSWPWMLPWC